MATLPTPDMDPSDVAELDQLHANYMALITGLITVIQREEQGVAEAEVSAKVSKLLRDVVAMGGISDDKMIDLAATAITRVARSGDRAHDLT